MDPYMLRNIKPGGKKSNLKGLFGGGGDSDGTLPYVPYMIFLHC